MLGQIFQLFPVPLDFHVRLFSLGSRGDMWQERCGMGSGVNYCPALVLGQLEVVDNWAFSLVPFFCLESL